MLAFGFSSGLPFLLVFGTLSVRLREAGVAVTTLGLFSWLARACSLKVIWAPAIDAFHVPVLARLWGRRRAWMIASQAVVLAGLIAAGLADPASSIVLTAAFTLVVAFGSATQDVVVDGWRIDAAPGEMQGIMAAAYQLGYRLALLCSGAGALYIAAFVDWQAAYFSMAALMPVGITARIAPPLVHPPPRPPPPLAKHPRFPFPA